MQLTRFPQSELAMCKTCEEHFFFARKVNDDSGLRQVEKKFAKRRLILGTR